MQVSTLREGRVLPSTRDMLEYNVLEPIVDEVFNTPCPIDHLYFYGANPGMSADTISWGGALATGGAALYDSIKHRKVERRDVILGSMALTAAAAIPVVKKAAEIMGIGDETIADIALHRPVNILMAELLSHDAEHANARLFRKDGINVTPRISQSRPDRYLLDVLAGDECLGFGSLTLMPEGFSPVVMASHQITPDSIALYHNEAANRLVDRGASEVYVTPAGWGTHLTGALAQGMILKPDFVSDMTPEEMRIWAMRYIVNPDSRVENMWKEHYGIRTPVFSSADPLFNILMAKIALDHTESPIYESGRTFVMHSYEGDVCQTTILDLTALKRFLSTEIPLVTGRKWTIWEPPVVLHKGSFDPNLPESTRRKFKREVKPVSFILKCRDNMGKERYAYLQCGRNINLPYFNSWNISNSLVDRWGLVLEQMYATDAGGSLGITHIGSEGLEVDVAYPGHDLAVRFPSWHTTPQHMVFLPHGEARGWS